MNEPRAQHTATLLDNGTVLVTGGSPTPGARSATAEIYNPATGTWRYTLHPMNYARRAHTAVKMNNGKILVAGGHASPPVGEIFDPVTETFTLTNPMNVNHDLSPGILLNDGRVLLLIGSLWFFGVGVSEIYDPSTNSWTTTPSIPVGVASMAGVGLPDGTVLAIGGYDGYTPSAYPFVRRYLPATNTVVPMASAVVSRLHHTATLMPDGKVLIVAGSNPSYTIASTELYDPAVPPNGFSQLSTSLNQGRRAHTATLLPNGDVLVVGGHQGGHGCCFGGSLTLAELRDRVSGIWSPAGNTAVALAYGHTATLLPSGDVLVAGGLTLYFSNNITLGTAELWTPPVLTVQIDIKPGSYPNSINLGSGGTVPVAILSSTTFDATNVDPLSVTLAGAAVKLKGKGTPMYSIQDVNNDGLPDLVVHVSTEALQLSEGDTVAVLNGSTFGGKAITGSDTVRIVP